MILGSMLNCCKCPLSHIIQILLLILGENSRMRGEMILGVYKKSSGQCEWYFFQFIIGIGQLLSLSILGYVPLTIASSFGDERFHPS